MQPAHDVHGVPVYLTLGADGGEQLLQRIRESLQLVGEVDGRHYRRLLHDGCAIVVFGGAHAHFGSAANVILLGPRRIREEPIAELAAAIVHEGTHARIDRWVGYLRRNRVRIERLCLREELAFFAQLAAAGRGQGIVPHLARRRAQYDAPLSTRTQRLEALQGYLRSIGVPRWLRVFVSVIARIRW